jgi:ribosome-associated protein
LNTKRPAPRTTTLQKPGKSSTATNKKSSTGLSAKKIAGAVRISPKKKTSNAAETSLTASAKRRSSAPATAAKSITKTAAKTSKPAHPKKQSKINSIDDSPKREAVPKRTRAAKSNTPIDQLRAAVWKRLDDMKGRDMTLIDVREKTSVTDYMVIVSGTSTRHVKSMADEVMVTAKKLGMMPLGMEGENEAEWVLVDLADIIVHVMLPKTRELYQLEKLWQIGPDAE